MEQTGEVVAQSPTGRGQDEDDALFGVTMTTGAYGTTNLRYDITTEDGAGRGPGPARPTRGPQDARSPLWWTREATDVVMDTIRRTGTCTSDDVRRHLRDEPSATGSAVGGLFRKLAREGRIVMDGQRPTTRPEGRGRYVHVWRAP